MRTVAPLMVIALTAILLAISLCFPTYLSDSGNQFLRGFVNQELLSLLGVIVAITLASAGNLHLALNRLQDATGREFPKTRRSVKTSAFSLIVLFAFGAALVIVKPLLGSGDRATGVANVLAISIIAFNLSVLIDLTLAAFKIPPTTALKGSGDDHPKP